MRRINIEKHSATRHPWPGLEQDEQLLHPEGLECVCLGARITDSHACQEHPHYIYVEPKPNPLEPALTVECHNSTVGKRAAGCQDNQVAAPCLFSWGFPIPIFKILIFFYSSRRFYCRLGRDNPYWHIYARFKQRNGNFWRRMARWHLLSTGAWHSANGHHM